MTRGPVPKPTSVRRNKHKHAQQLGAEPRPGRELPRGLGVTTAGARRFWRTWSQAPQTASWVETDWAELEITARLVDEFFKGDLKVASEIRMRTAKWGATVEDRSRLRMSLKDRDEAAETTGPEPTPADMDEELYRLLNG